MPLLVATKVKPSSIHGLGLFADQDIAKDAVVWEHSPGYDGWFYCKTWQLFPKALQDYIKHFCCYDRHLHAYIRAGDNANWMNHSDTPNLNAPNYYIHIANRDITTGEELTVNYKFIGDEDTLFHNEFNPEENK